MLSGECEPFCVCCTSAVLGLRPSSTESQMPQLWSLFLLSVEAPWKHSHCPLSALSGAWCRESSQGSSQWSRAEQDLQYHATAVAWGCCPDWDAFPEDQPQPSEAVLNGEYNCRLESPWSQLLRCRS